MWQFPPMANIQVKKHNKRFTTEELNALSKEELVATIQALQAHNLQLRNIIAKQVTACDGNKNKQNKFKFSNCTFRHVMLKFYYLGWDYRGYAAQEDTINTIEHYLFNALIRTCLIKDRATSNYHRCGRTDKGVSSFGQVISIDLRSKLHEDCQNDLANEIDYCKLVNKVLPSNIQCVAWCPADANISARFDCKSRSYKYFFPKDNLNIENMREACTYLLGSHDFRNFCKMDVGNGVVHFMRNIVSIDINPFQSDSDNEYSMYFITIKGKAFLWHQIRCIMGILFLIGLNKESPLIIKELLDVEKNPRKPDYNIANEVPLNLYSCEYDINDEWFIDHEALDATIHKLKTIWMFSSIKSTMMMSMMNDLIQQKDKNMATACQPMIDGLLQGVRAKNYIPLMKRQKCESLENRIKHYVKRSKLEVVKNE